MKQAQFQTWAENQLDTERMLTDELLPKIARMEASGDRSAETVAWLTRARQFAKEAKSELEEHRDTLESVDPILMENLSRKRRREQVVKAMRSQKGAA